MRAAATQMPRSINAETTHQKQIAPITAICTVELIVGRLAVSMPLVDDCEQRHAGDRDHRQERVE
jgi:hypothetical protein